LATKYIGGVSIDTIEEMKERHPADFYPTEQALIDAYLKNTDVTQNKQIITVADLGAGDGRWGRSVKNWSNNRPIPVPCALAGIDIRDLPKPDGFDFWQSGEQGSIYNFLNICNSRFDLIIGNPPFSILDDWLEVCFEIVNKNKGMISLLLSLNILSGIKRYKKYYNNEFPLSRLVVCSTRPSFSENGKTYPGREYGIFEWRFSNGKCLNSGDTYDRNGLDPIDFLTYERSKNRN